MNDRFLFKGEYRYKISVWNIDLVEQIKSIKLQNDNKINALAINDRYLFVGSLNIITILELASLKVMKLLEFDGKYNWAERFSIKDVTLFSAHSNNSIRIWNIDMGEILRVLADYEDEIKSLAVNKRFIFSGGVYNSIKVWDINTGKFLYKLTGFDDIEWVVFDNRACIINSSKTFHESIPQSLENTKTYYNCKIKFQEEL